MRVADYYLLTIDKALQDEVLLSSGLKLYIDNSYTPEWFATTYGTVACKPQGVTNVAVGDEVAISYSVIADRTWPDASASFFPVKEGDPYLAQWKNGRDQWLTRVALPTPSRSIIWVVTLQDSRMNLIDGMQGSEKEAERYMAQFSFQDTGKYKHTNQLNINEKIFWKAQKNGIFAIRRDQEIISVSDRVILEPIEEDWTERYRIQDLLQHPNDVVKMMYTDRGKVISGGDTLGLSKGDIAGFQPRFCEKYTLWGKKYFSLRKAGLT
jgi:hypothetical protein